MSARMIQVIETELSTRGQGIEGDPIRSLRQFWSVEGELLAEVDSWQGTRQLRQARELAEAQARINDLTRRIGTLDDTCQNLAVVVKNMEIASLSYPHGIRAALHQLGKAAKRSPVVRDAVARLQATIADGAQRISDARHVSLLK